MKPTTEQISKCAADACKFLGYSEASEDGVAKILTRHFASEPETTIEDVLLKATAGVAKMPSITNPPSQTADQIAEKWAYEWVKKPEVDILKYRRRQVTDVILSAITEATADIAKELGKLNDQFAAKDKKIEELMEAARWSTSDDAHKAITNYAN